MSAKPRILFVSHEMNPYLQISEIAQAALQLPKTMQERGMEIRVLMPRYGSINERKHRLHEVVRLSGINIVIGETDNPLIIKVASLPQARMQVYFLDNEDFFHRKHGIRDDKGKFFADNHERMIFFNKGVLETIVKLGWAPDIIHCNGWMTSLIPLYLKRYYRHSAVFAQSRLVYSVHPSQFKEKLGKDLQAKARIEMVSDEDLACLAPLDENSLHQLAIQHADAVTYAESLGDSFPHADPAAPIITFNSQNLADVHQDLYQTLLQSVTETVGS